MGAERIRGELLKLGIRLNKRTIQKYMRAARPPRAPGQRWATFLRNHAPRVWARDFLQTYDIFFRPLFALAFVCLGTHEVVHVGVTRHPTSASIPQRRREATPCGTAPRFFTCDNDSKYGLELDRIAAASGIRVLRTPHPAPNANAICERFLGSLRRECLDHILLLRTRHLLRVAREYPRYFNTARPHQGLARRIPAGSTPPSHCEPRRGDAGARRLAS
jgi:transposase InsO family protein